MSTAGRVRAAGGYGVRGRRWCRLPVWVSVSRVRRPCMSSRHVAFTRVRSFTRSVSGGVGHFNGARRPTGQSACPMASAISRRGSTWRIMKASVASFTVCHDVLRRSAPDCRFFGVARVRTWVHFLVATCSWAVMICPNPLVLHGMCLLLCSYR